MINSELDISALLRTREIERSRHVAEGRILRELAARPLRRERPARPAVSLTGWVSRLFNGWAMPQAEADPCCAVEAAA